jgi:hypothetical protein
MAGRSLELFGAPKGFSACDIDSMPLSPQVMNSGPKPCSSGVAKVAEHSRHRPLSELRMYSPWSG